MKQEDTIIVKDVGKRILECRKRLGLTQEQAAELAGVSHQFFSVSEIGKKNMRAENIVKVANAFGVSTDYLLTGKRSNSELNDFASKISVLDEQEMDLLAQVIELFIMACKKDR